MRTLLRSKTLNQTLISIKSFSKEIATFGVEWLLLIATGVACPVLVRSHAIKMWASKIPATPSAVTIASPPIVHTNILLPISVHLSEVAYTYTKVHQ